MSILNSVPVDQAITWLDNYLKAPPQYRESEVERALAYEVWSKIRGELEQIVHLKNEIEDQEDRIYQLGLCLAEAEDEIDSLMFAKGDS